MKNHCNDFSAAAVLLEIKRQRQTMRRKRYRRSSLMTFRAELVALRHEGASLADLKLFLQSHRVKAARSTIGRYLKQLPELRKP
jgi:hypothetical protein